MKYTYTPRRRSSLRRSSPLIPPLALAPLLVLVVIGGYLLVRHGDDKPNTAAAVLTANCQPGKCAAPATSVPRRLVPAAARGGGASAAAPAPQITGTAAFVLEDACDAVLYQLAPDTRSPPASVTKIMTALVAAEHSQMNDPVPITVDGSELSASTDSTVMGLQPGWTLSMRDLLYGLLLPSGADAAIQIAKHVAGSVPAFVQMMNQKAADLGLKNTHFTNPHGLDDPAHYASARDIAILGSELLRDPELAAIVKTKSYQPDWPGPALENLNLMLDTYSGAIGVKTGFTDQAGQTIVAAAERDGRRIIVSVMGAKTEIYADTSSLLDWAFQQASACTAVGQGTRAAGGG